MFGEEEGTIRVFESDGIVADAAAGADYIKVRADALFNERDVRALEVHEGLVHVGTTLNGLSQPICTFLAKGPPSSTVTQEGLAILMEVIAFASYPTRLRKLTNRTRAIHMAEEGADFLDVFHFYREQGYSLEDSYQNASRVFRGSTPDGLPFTKDLSYLKGFILIYNYIQLAVRKGKLEQIPCCSAARPPWKTCAPCANWWTRAWWRRRSTCRRSSATSTRCRPGCASRTSSTTSAWTASKRTTRTSSDRSPPCRSFPVRAGGRPASKENGDGQPRTRLPHPRRIHADRGDRTRPRKP